jgi:hypothetical protein
MDAPEWETGQGEIVAFADLRVGDWVPFSAVNYAITSITRTSGGRIRVEFGGLYPEQERLPDSVFYNVIRKPVVPRVPVWA